MTVNISESPFDRGLKDLKPEDFKIFDFSKGNRRFPLPFKTLDRVSDSDRVLYQSAYSLISDIKPEFAFEMAGQREALFFDPKETAVGIVSCGGMAAGLNDVIRSISYTCFKYGVKKVYGFKFGWYGLGRAHRSYIEITPEILTNVHLVGGSFLGLSRADIPSDEVAETCCELGVNVLFCIGGDGTQRGAAELNKTVIENGKEILVFGIPKTMDNDIMYVTRTFGFETAFNIASDFIKGAHVECKGMDNGVCLIRLFGRDSGFIAVHAALASGYANIVLIPEEKFTLRALLAAIKKRILEHGHCLIVAAEGAGLDIMKAENWIRREDRGKGNTFLGNNGEFLMEKIKYHFQNVEKLKIETKFIDPTYCIRNSPPSGSDAAFCEELGNKAVHSAFAGKSSCIIGYWNERFTLVPFEMVTKGRKIVDVNGGSWSTVKSMCEDLTSIEEQLANAELRNKERN